MLHLWTARCGFAFERNCCILLRFSLHIRARFESKFKHFALVNYCPYCCDLVGKATHMYRHAAGRQRILCRNESDARTASWNIHET